MKKSASLVTLVVTAAFLLVPLCAAADTYVLTAAKWGAKQTTAVQQSGGTVVWSHAASGLAAASSSRTDFLARALKTRAFLTVDKDMVVQWQKPEQLREVGLIEAAITPGNETFINAQWNILAVEAPDAWANGCTGYGVRVAVLDGGIRPTHIDLAGTVDTACSASFVAGKQFYEDTSSHATHVAGIVAARDNGIGTIGIAPEATILGVKVLDNGSGSFSQIIGGILYAAEPGAFGVDCAGADVINMSLGAVFPRNVGGPAGLIAAINKAVNYANSRGALVVSSAGNDAIDFGQAKNLVGVPGSAGAGIAVSATGPEGFAVNFPYGATNFRDPASYSSYGEGFVSLAGPGGDFRLPGTALCSVPRVPSGSVTTQCWVFDMVMSLSRNSNTTYTWMAGTSMAAPAVAAVAALVKQRYPWMTPGDIRDFLQATADDEGSYGADQFYGHGFVNARRACTE